MSDMDFTQDCHDNYFCWTIYRLKNNRDKRYYCHLKTVLYHSLLAANVKCGNIEVKNDQDYVHVSYDKSIYRHDYVDHFVDHIVTGLPLKCTLTSTLFLFFPL